MSDLFDQARQWSRAKYDSLFCKDWKDIERFGEIDSWHVKTGGLDRRSIVYSAGVGQFISFEREFIKRFEATIELFDPSPTGVRTMSRQENQLAQIRFHPVGLAGGGVQRVKFSFPDNELEGSYRFAKEKSKGVEFECKDLGTLMKERGHGRIDLLKMDIEGFEYGVIADIVGQSIDVNQICVEFHHFMSGISRTQTRSAMLALRSAGYTLIHKKGFDHTFYRTG